ncbi:MAG TPA: response regulator [Candidatus Binataceae bacterium]|jgi:two-component system, NtrC family, response regulator HydG|nr:response regulator [Candidatus Binataceae bacterium]
MAARILVVDDELDLVDTCARLIEGLGYVCLKAFDGPEAILMLRTEHPDLIVTDFNLPHGDGLEILRCAHENSPEIPVIMMTGYHTADMAQAASDAGAKAYLRKPFLTNELTEAVRSALELSRR